MASVCDSDFLSICRSPFQVFSPCLCLCISAFFLKLILSICLRLLSITFSVRSRSISFELHLISAGLVVRVKLNCRDTQRMEVNSSIKTGGADNWAGFSFPCMIKMPVDRALSASENVWERDGDFSFFYF